MERHDLENARWGNLQWRNESKAADFDTSFRSEDSEILALWEEKSEAGFDRLGGRRGKMSSADAGRQKVVGIGSPWRDSVSNAVKKIEIFSHAVANSKEKARTTWPRCSPIHPKAAGMDSPRLSVDKRGSGGRSPWRDVKIMTNTSLMTNDTEALLHNSPKARYNYISPCRRGEFETSPSPMTAPKLFCQAVTCELQLGSSKSIDFNSRRTDDEREERSIRRVANQDTNASIIEKELNMRCVQAINSFNRGDLSNRGVGVIERPTDIPEETPPRATLWNVSNTNDVGNRPRASTRALSRHSTKLSLDSAVEGALPLRFFVEAGEKMLSRQCTKLSVKTMPESMETWSAQPMEGAMLNQFASDAGAQQSKAETVASGEQKARHRYYQRVTCAERSSRWSSSDGNFLDAIDFVAPSAARFVEGSDGCVSPVLAPIKSQGAVPFLWEMEPGKPKELSESHTDQFQSALQLPPRLAVSQQKHDLRNRNINAAMSEADALPNSKPSSSLKHPRIQSDSERTTKDFSERVPVKVKSRSIGEVRAALHNLSRQSAGDAGVGDSRTQCIGNAPQASLPAHGPGKVRPTSPTSILCGPDDGSRPSSNPSLCSEPEAPLNSVTIAPSLSHGSSPSPAASDPSESTSPESSLTSPLRANSRCNSMSFDDKHKEGASQSGNALVKFYRNGRRWMKSKGPKSKLGTILSPEVFVPHREVPDTEHVFSRSKGIGAESAGRPSMEKQGGSDFADRLEGKPPLQISTTDHSNFQTDYNFAPSTILHEDLENWSPAYAATLELLSPLQTFSSKQKNLHKKSSGRMTSKSTRRLRVRVRVRARFLVPIRRVLRKVLSRCQLPSQA